MKLLNDWARGELLAELRRDKRLTQEELSKRVGLSRGQIQRHERGENISIVALDRYAHFYGVGCEYILYGVSNRYCDDVQSLMNKLDEYLSFQKNLPNELETICKCLHFELIRSKKKQ